MNSPITAILGTAGRVARPLAVLLLFAALAAPSAHAGSYVVATVQVRIRRAGRLTVVSGRAPAGARLRVVVPSRPGYPYARGISRPQ